MKGLSIVILVVALAALIAAPLTKSHAACPGIELPFPAGVPDEFALPTEPTAPDPAYEAYMQGIWPQPPTRQFDGTGIDETLIHTFSGWIGPVCGARLEIRIRGDDSALSDNDSVRLSLVGGDDPALSFRYWSTFRSIFGSWGPGAVATLHLDLADLPPRSDFPTNVLGDLSDGRLEIAVEDDTAVDYAVLAICQCPVSVEESTWGRAKATYR